MDHGAGYPRSDGAGFEPGPQQEARLGPTGRAFEYPVLDQMAYLPAPLRLRAEGALRKAAPSLSISKGF
jgi:hypothetical protein